jgi:hypothetical protein
VIRKHRTPHAISQVRRPRHASPEDPQYEIKGDKTDHIAMHKGGGLTKIK